MKLFSVRTNRNGRRLLTSEQKAYIVDSWESSGRSAPEFCRQYGLIATPLYKWRTDAKRGAVMGIRHAGELHSRTELEALRKENEELKKALGEASLDIRILKKARNGRTEKSEVEDYSRAFQVSQNRVINFLYPQRISRKTDCTKTRFASGNFNGHTRDLRKQGNLRCSQSPSHSKEGSWYCAE